MIQWYGIKEWLLMKAVNMIKNRQGLVQVERVVTKRGKTFTQHFWVLPNEVKTTDIVVAGHGNLLNGHPQKLHKHIPLNIALPQAVKDVARAYFSQFSSRQSLFIELKSMGISWVEEAEERINNMRAKTALNIAIIQGWNPPGVPSKLMDSARKAIETEVKPKLKDLPNVFVQPAQPPKQMKDITESNMYFCGNPRFNTDVALDTSIHKIWYKKITHLMFKCINAYTHHSKILNHWLRGILTASKYDSLPHKGIRGLFGMRLSEYEFLKKQTQNIDEAIDKYELPDDIIVYRIMDIGKNPGLLKMIMDKAKKGEKWTDNAFMSTSTRPVVDESLVDHFDTKLRKFVMFKIKIPKGKGRGAYIAPFAKRGYNTQCEFLVGRGAQLSINPNYTMTSRSEYVPGATETNKDSYVFECELTDFQRQDVDTLKPDNSN